MHQIEETSLQSDILPRDVVFPPPFTPTIMMTAGFLVKKKKKETYDDIQEIDNKKEC